MPFVRDTLNSGFPLRGFLLDSVGNRGDHFLRVETLVMTEKPNLKEQ